MAICARYESMMIGMTIGEGFRGWNHVGVILCYTTKDDANMREKGLREWESHGKARVEVEINNMEWRAMIGT